MNLKSRNTSETREKLRLELQDIERYFNNEWIKLDRFSRVKDEELKKIVKDIKNDLRQAYKIATRKLFEDNSWFTIGGGNY